MVLIGECSFFVCWKLDGKWRGEISKYSTFSHYLYVGNEINEIVISKLMLIFQELYKNFELFAIHFAYEIIRK